MWNVTVREHFFICPKRQAHTECVILVNSCQKMQQIGKKRKSITEKMMQPPDPGSHPPMNQDLAEGVIFLEHAKATRPNLLTLSK